MAESDIAALVGKVGLGGQTHSYKSCDPFTPKTHSNTSPIDKHPSQPNRTALRLIPCSTLCRPEPGMGGGAGRIGVAGRHSRRALGGWSEAVEEGQQLVAWSESSRSRMRWVRACECSFFEFQVGVQVWPRGAD